ncbi:MAG: LemA family protein [Clostridiales bacterium]|nr:LemA family protein [Clostridiales bacterium]
MSGKFIPWIVIGAIILILIFSAIGSYNRLVNLNEDVNNKLSQIDNQLQLRNDLIPNLVATVKGFAAHEEEILKNVSDARAKLAGATSPGQMAEGDAELTGALSRLLVVVENYPDLKADANFRQLSDNLAGTENRISVARRDYNESATQYNTAIRRFPTNIMAGIFGFEKVEYFQAQEGAEEVPKVDFGV